MNLGYGNANENPEELALVAKFILANSKSEVAELVLGYIATIPYDDRVEALTTIVAQMAQFVRVLEQAANLHGVHLADDLMTTIDRMEFEELTKDLDLGDG
ncbi:MAG: hypothetical protein KJ659_09115 [Actinobacteria bacterium]|nr:hypothetical protein [Actinomycetota bacterium]MBU1607825.1 hypothetical protein [Actinomycetota bacterium]MBU2314679.1 hypothetical protein [Actinomycetota bacterium]MBU2385640.1 hypothetical protein [Actinomycetota bacterium]